MDPDDSLFDALDLPLVLTTREGVIVRCNDAARRLLGLSEEAAGRPLSGWLARAFGRQWLSATLTDASQPGWRAHDVRLLTGNGEERPAELSVRHLPAPSGEPLALIRLTARESGSHAIDLGDLLDISPDSMVVVDESGTIQMINEQLERLFGYSGAELVGQRIEVLVPERFRANHPRYRATYVANPRRRPMGAGLDLYGRRKDGTEFPAEISLSPIRTGGRLVVVAAIRDIADRRRLETLRRETLEQENRRVVEANRLKSEFLANMSHELRTPLNAIIGFAELLHDGRLGSVTESQKEYLGDILSSSQHLLGLINDLLDLAKIESGKLEFRPAPVEIAPLINEVRDVLRGLASSKNIDVQLEIDPGLTEVILDPNRLRQILFNYLSNALKFTGQQGRVQIRVRAEGPNSFRLEVQDNGIGIPSEQMHELFQRFTQLEAGKKTGGASSGLGLSLTRMLVEAQGGRVGARSKPGVGSTFYAVLPRVASGAENAASLEPLARDGRPQVLVVEDDPLDRAALSTTLLELGYRPVVAADAHEAIALAQKQKFQAITLDLLLPDMSGWEVLNAIRVSSLNGDTPTVVVSVASEQGLGRLYPIEAVLQKPVGVEELGAALSSSGLSAGPDRPVLVIEDDLATRKLVQQALSLQGYRVLACSNGEEALEILKDERPGAVILDLLMPGMSGFEFLDHFAATPELRATPVLVWTVKELTPEERRRVSQTADTVLSKRRGGTVMLVHELQRLFPPRARLPAVTAAEDEHAP